MAIEWWEMQSIKRKSLFIKWTITIHHDKDGWSWMLGRTIVQYTLFYFIFFVIKHQLNVYVLQSWCIIFAVWLMCVKQLFSLRTSHTNDDNDGINIDRVKP